MINPYTVRVTNGTRTLPSTTRTAETEEGKTEDTTKTTTTTSNTQATVLSQDDWDILEGKNDAGTNSRSVNTANNTVTIKALNGQNVEFEYTPYETYFNDVILKKFTDLLKQTAGGGFAGYRPSVTNAPLLFVTLDSANNVVITDEACKNICKYSYTFKFFPF